MSVCCSCVCSMRKLCLTVRVIDMKSDSVTRAFGGVGFLHVYKIYPVVTGALKSVFDLFQKFSNTAFLFSKPCHCYTSYCVLHSIY